MMLLTGVGQRSRHPNRSGGAWVKAYPERYSTEEWAIQSGEPSMNIAVWGQGRERCGEGLGTGRVPRSQSFLYGEKQPIIRSLPFTFAR